MNKNLRMLLFKRLVLLIFFGSWSLPGLGQSVSDSMLIPYRKGNVWGYANREREIIIEPVFDYAAFFKGTWAIVTKDKKYGLINRQGKFLAEPKYDDFTISKNGLIHFREKNRYGYLDTLGNEVPEPEYVRSITVENGKAYEIRDHLEMINFETPGFDFLGPNISAVIYKDENGFPRITLMNNDGQDLLPLNYVLSYAFPLNGKPAYKIGTWKKYEKNEFGEVIRKPGQKQKFGLMNDQFKLIVPVMFQGLAIEENFIIVWDGSSKFGLWDYVKNRKLTKQNFDHIEVTRSPSRAAVTLSGKQGLIDSTGKFIIPLGGKIKGFVPHSIEQITDSLYLAKKYKVIRKNKLSSQVDSIAKEPVLTLTDLKGNNLFTPIYRNFDLRKKEGLVILSNDILISYFNLSGKVLASRNRANTGKKFTIEEPKIVTATDLDARNLNSCYYLQQPLQNNFAIIGNHCLYGNGSFGVVDAAGKVTVPLNFNQIFPVSSTALAVRDGNKWGIIRPDGSALLPMIYNAIIPLEDGNFLTGETNDGFTLRNNEGEIISSEKLLSEPQFTDKTAWVPVNEGMVLIDRTGKIIKRRPYILHDINLHAYSRPGFYKVEHKERWGFKNRAEQLVIPQSYSLVKTFRDGLAAVKKEGRWGYIDKSGKVVIPFQYLEALSFSNGKALADSGTGYQVINKKGEILFPEKYQDALPFNDGLAAVYNNGKWGFINENGELVIPYKFKFVSGFINGLSAFQKDEGLGIMDKSGKELVPDIYQKMMPIQSEFFWLYKDGVWYKRTRQGVAVATLTDEQVSGKKAPYWEEIYNKWPLTKDGNKLPAIKHLEMTPSEKDDLVPAFLYNNIYYYADAAGNHFYEE